MKWKVYELFNKIDELGSYVSILVLLIAKHLMLTITYSGQEITFYEYITTG